MMEVSWPSRIPAWRIPACPSPRRWDQAKQFHEQDTSTQYPC